MSETLVINGCDRRTHNRRESGEKYPHARGKNPHACGIAIDMDGLRGFLINKHPRKTSESVAADTGVPEKTVQRWLYADPTEPSGLNMMRLFIAYRAPFVSAALVNCPDWLNEQAIEARNAELDKRIADARAQKIEAPR